MEEVFKERGVDGGGVFQLPGDMCKRMGWNTMVFADAKSCHYIGNQDIEPVLKRVEDCVKIALSGRMEAR